MLHAYIDESGLHQGASHFVLAGFVAGARKWDELEPLWVGHLEDAGVDDFHAKDFFKRAGSFYGWTESQMVGLCERLIEAVKPAGLLPIGGVTPIEGFSDRREWERRILTGGIAKAVNHWKESGKPSSPYFMAFPIVLIQAAAHVLDAPDHVGVHFFFDAQDEYEGLALRFFSRLQQNEGRYGKRMVRLVYRSRRNTPLLGVADLFAHLLYLQQTGTMRHPVQQWSLEQLLLRERESKLTLFDASSMDTILSFVSQASPGLFDAT